jgi:site-specific recombinase XerD
VEPEIEAFLTDRRARGLSGRTVQFYRCELGTWHEWLGERGVSDVGDVSADLLRHWLLHLGQRRNRGGVHANYRALKAFLRWVWEENEITTRNPIRKVRPPKLSQEVLDPVSMSDLKALLETCDNQSFYGCRDLAMQLALLDTGCRANEFLSLDIGDVDLTTGSVLVRHGKGGKQRMTFLGTKSRKAIRRYLRYRQEPAEDEPLWVTPRGKRLTYSGLRSLLRRRSEKACISCPSLHSFRRAFAITSLRNGVDVYSLQRLMGHSDLTMLRRYLKHTTGDLREAHRKAGPVDNTL